MQVKNGESVVITVVSDGNPDVSIQPGESVVIDLDIPSQVNREGKHKFSTDSFYVVEEGDWYAEIEGDQITLYDRTY